MTNDEFQECLNKEIDGVATPSESAALHRYLLDHPDAKLLYDDMVKLNAALRRVEQIEPPAGLAMAIMALIPADRATAKPRGSFLSRVREFIESPASFQYAYVFAAGLVVGVALYSFVGNSSTTHDHFDLSGSIITTQPAFPTTEGPGFDVAVADAGIEGKVRTKYSESLVAFEIDLRSADALLVRIDYDRNSLQFRGYSQFESIPGDLVVSDERVQLVSQGENRYLLAFTRKGGEPCEIAFRLEKSGQELFEKRINLGRQTLNNAPDMP